MDREELNSNEAKRGGVNRPVFVNTGPSILIVR